MMHTDKTPYTDAGWTPELIAEFEARYTCDDSRCENGYIEGEQYVTHTGEVDTRYWPCPTCVGGGMRSEEEYDYCEEDESEEGPEEAPDAQLIREDIAGINDWLRRGTWVVLICAGMIAAACTGSSPGKKLAAEKLNNTMWWVTEMRPVIIKGKPPAVRITITDGQTGRIFTVPASHPYRHTGLFTWLYTPTDQNPDTDQVEDYLTPRYEEVIR